MPSDPPRELFIAQYAKARPIDCAGLTRLNKVQPAIRMFVRAVRP